MPGRYERVFTLASDLYCEGSPIIVAAGALLKDVRTNGVLAQLKFRSVTERVIKALRITLQPYDVTGATLGVPVSGQYLDLSVGRDEEFGQKVPIALPDASARSFAPASVEVIFVDGGTWKDGDGAWEPLPGRRTLAEWLGDDELVRQFRMEYGQQCEYEPDAVLSLWRCACRAVNGNEEGTCHVCGIERERIMGVDLDELTKDVQARHIAEEEERGAQERARAEKGKRARRIAVVVAGAAVLALAAFLVSTRVVIPQMELSAEYDTAMTLLDDGSYALAARAFENLGDFSDAADMAERSRASGYEAALGLLEDGSYDEAKTLFLSLGSYEDSQEKAAECGRATAYEHALNLLENGEYMRARKNFADAGDYKDAAEYLDKLVLVPDQIDVEGAHYTFQYDESGRMKGATRQRTDGFSATYNLVFSPEGVLTEATSSTGTRVYRSTIEYSQPDGIVKRSSEESATLYDEYGNKIAYWLRGGWHALAYGGYPNELAPLDAHHNPIHSVRGYAFDYDSEGNLTRIYRPGRDVCLTAEYQVLYLTDGTVDKDLIWRNIRLMENGYYFER